MKINIKSVNPKFSQKLADERHEGEETEDNVKYLWEDDFDVKGNVKDFKVKNNAVYSLKGEFADGKTFEHEFSEMTIIECYLEDGSLSQFPIAKKLIQSTDKKISRDGEKLFFHVFLKGAKEIVNPFDGAYFEKKDWPADLPVRDEDDDDEDEEFEDDEPGTDEED
ncbi:MAG: hypothetical protein IAF38_12170 [Bacteroidia bacterium]|nr:hypothetical protein [Bacteroidia bacterium]